MTNGIAFIGLGVMGAPMAERLAAAGYDTVVYNRSAAKAEKLAKTSHIRAATSVSDAVSQAKIVITMLPDSPDVVEVLTSPGGVFAHSSHGALIVDMSTISPDVSRDLAADADNRGLRFLEAPVSGGEVGAVNGTLSIMVGGSAVDLEQVRLVLKVLGKTIIHVGGHGAGQTVKAANQLIVAGTIEIVSEALTLLRARDVDMESAVAVLSGGLASSRVLENKAANFLSRDFRPGFRVALHDKDLRIARAAASAAGVVMPLGTLVGELMASANVRGDGGLDHSALIRGVELLSGHGPEN